MFKRFIHWLFDIREEPPLAVEEPLSDDPWERMFQLADVLRLAQLVDLDNTHLDVRPLMFSDNIAQLYERMEMIITSIQDEEAQHPTWKARRRELLAVPAPDYYYSSKFGYRHPQDVLAIMLEKIAIIHHLLETKAMDDQHVYHPYLKREFTAVVRDVCTILEFKQTLVTPE